jgi:hypothetical protein
MARSRPLDPQFRVIRCQIHQWKIVSRESNANDNQAATFAQRLQRNF